MGSGLSRSKRIAPVCVVEINVSKRDAPAASRPGEARNSFKRFKIPNFTNATHFSQVDRERRDSPRFTEEEEEEEEEDEHRGKVDRAGRDDEDQENISKTKKSFVRSRTYGLCNFKRVDSNAELNFTTTTPSQAFTSSESRGRECGSEDVNKSGNNAFSHVRKQHRGLGPSHSCVEQVPKTGNDSSFANCLNTPVATPVILYDGSEEELMDTIEREFS